MTALTVRQITSAQHRAFIDSRDSVSFLQTPEWAQVKREWKSVSLGWFAGEELVGAGLVLFREAPVIKRSLAYLPEGPDIDWFTSDLNAWLEPLLTYLKQAGSFTVKIGVPVPIRRWHNDTIKNAIGVASRLADVTPDWVEPRAEKLRAQLQASGWKQETAETGFGDVQPRYVFTVDIAGRTDDELLTSFNQLWRRNLKKADKSGVTVRIGTREDLAAFHTAYVETAARDGFRPRPLAYFERYWDAFNALPDCLRLYLAEVDGEVAAATIWIRSGKHAWYSYGASTTRHRDFRPSNAIQWRMLRDSRDLGCHTYDLRGISDTLEESNPLFGLIRFKLGIGGQAVEVVGEHDFDLNRPLAWLFRQYLKRR